MAKSASFPLTLALPQGEGTRHPARQRVEALWVGESAASDSPSPKGEGWGEGEATLETPMRLRTADELNDTATVRSAMQGRAPRTRQRLRFRTRRRERRSVAVSEGPAAARRNVRRR